ncbi:MAG: T9SS type A sorting domain-containing protein [Bacteroidota bacterium]
MNHYILLLLSSFLLSTASNLNAQITRHVLFLGNSYTNVNDLPQLVHDVALSAGDTLIFDSYTPGGYTLEAHSIDPTSQNKIATGGWDYVVIQGQSQEPITYSSHFADGGHDLNALVQQTNPCAVTMPYMTWGRKNGDAGNCLSFPVMCTYQGMDTTLRNKYIDLAKGINGEVSPVSVVWNYLRQNNPSIELYQADESHPSVEGSYAAACCFYASLFKKDPTLITFNSTLSSTDASIIRNAAKTQVFDSLQLWDFKKPPIAHFRYDIGAGINEARFIALSYGVLQNYFWDFGDGDSASTAYASHSYLTDGTYIVTLTTSTCDLQGLHTATADTVIQFCSHTPTIYTNQPWVCQHDTLWTQAADSYQWIGYAGALPETNQYLPDYSYYSGLGISVISTLNGCSELSAAFTNSPQSSGYYFDGIGTPCNGDSVAFIVLHQSGSLSGFETIVWFKNDTLLTSMTNEDTLYITTDGKYQCSIIDPNAQCPLDSTTSVLEYDCSASGVEEKDQELSWSIFPNPATESITVKFTNNILKEQIEIYSVTGSLIKEIKASETTEINITDLPNGLYFIRLKNNKQTPLKFIKQ